MSMPRRPVLTTGALFAATLAAPWLAEGQASAAVPMAVAVGKTDITPELGIPLAGYATDTPRLAAGVSSALRAVHRVLGQRDAERHRHRRRIGVSPRHPPGDPVANCQPRGGVLGFRAHGNPYPQRAVLNPDVPAYTLYNILDPSARLDRVRGYAG
jgi:hypothetical protein